MMKYLFLLSTFCFFSVGFSQSKISETGTWCNGDLTLNAQLETGETVLYWEFENTILKSENNATIACAKFGYGTYKVYIQNKGMELTVESYLVAKPTDVLAGFKATNYLAAGVASFEDSSVSTEKIVAWHWDFGNGQTSDLQHPKVAFKEQKEYVVTLTVTTSSGCKHSITQHHIWSY